MRAFRSVCRMQISPVREAPIIEILSSGGAELCISLGAIEEMRIAP